MINSIIRINNYNKKYYFDNSDFEKFKTYILYRLKNRIIKISSNGLYCPLLLKRLSVEELLNCFYFESKDKNRIFIFSYSKKKLHNLDCCSIIKSIDYGTTNSFARKIFYPLFSEIRNEILSKLTLHPK